MPRLRGDRLQDILRRDPGELRVQALGREPAPTDHVAFHDATVPPLRPDGDDGVPRSNPDFYFGWDVLIDGVG